MLRAAAAGADHATSLAGAHAHHCDKLLSCLIVCRYALSLEQIDCTNGQSKHQPASMLSKACGGIVAFLDADGLAGQAALG